MYETGVRILKATVGIRSNSRDLLPPPPPKNEVKSLLTDFREMTEIPYSSDLDGQIVLKDTAGRAALFKRRGRKATFSGPLRRLERQASDLRYSLWGNQGFLYRFILYLLEARHHIFSLHACGLLDERRNVLYVVAGGAGSGKTVYLLSGIGKGLRIFSTETVHFKFRKGRTTWFKGSLVDNVRLGTLVHDFPRFMPSRRQPSRSAQAWQDKIALDLSSYQTGQDILIQPRLVILFPRVEERRKGFFLAEWKDPRPAVKAVFDNLSQKIAETVVLYDRVAMCGLDDPGLAAARLKAASRLVENPSTVKMASVLSGPADCWGQILEES